MTMHEANLLHAFNAWAARKTFDAVARSLLHMADHGTCHRGKIVTLLRKLGVRPPSTGMIRFFREATQRA